MPMVNVAQFIFLGKLFLRDSFFHRIRSASWIGKLGNDSTGSYLSSTKMWDGHLEYSLFVMCFRFLISWASEYETSPNATLWVANTDPFAVRGLKNFGYWEVPYLLKSDNGPPFIAEVIREIYNSMGVSDWLTPSH